MTREVNPVGLRLSAQTKKDAAAKRSPDRKAPRRAKKRIADPKRKFAEVRAAMKASLIERDEEIDVVLTALIAQENPLLVGPPGTAKSLLLDTLMRWMGEDTKKFSILLGKYSLPDEVFGTLDPMELKQGRFVRNTTNKLPEADVAFVDEIFKASTAILNTMLRIMNERVFENGDGSFLKCPLKIMVSASNEVPHDGENGKELGALWDRFLFRKFVKQVSPAGRKRLLWERDHDPVLTSHISPGELARATEEAKAIEWSEEAAEALESILEALNKEGIYPGDRRQYKSVMAAQAFAYLEGSDMVEPCHLEILKHVLWEDPTEQPTKAAKIICRIANPIGSKITDLLVKAIEISEKNTPSEAVPKLQEVQRELQDLPTHDRKESAVNHIANEIKRHYNKVIGAR